MINPRRWIVIAAVAAAVAAIAVAFLLTTIVERRQEAQTALDWWGLVLFSGALSLLVLALLRGETEGWGSAPIVATIPSPGRLLLHRQQNPEHPDFEVTRALREQLEGETDAAGRPFDIVDLPAPETLRDHEGFVDWSYVNHLVVNGGVIACGFGEERADAAAREILADAYPGRRVVTVDSREIFARGGGIHCITQQQPVVAR